MLIPPQEPLDYEAVSSALGWTELYDLLLRFYDYFITLSENTMLHLAIFAGAIMVYFMGRLSLNYYTIKRSRRAIPLVIGGWGTRGKSGTERIKAALFHALGCEILVKTTGNEAMFIHSVPEQKPLELFLFRPYDKATIWEQKTIIKLAAGLGAQVLMWECMALTPRYVRLLERVWMKDDITTITNTYPDHEDIQGPAGINIPQVMTNFVPRKRICFTAEEQMLPILQQAARDQETTLQAVNWRDVELLTDDILDRFPYKEHPANIAMVLDLMEHLGVEKDFALKEMADNVVPDIGVLKTYPTAYYLGRKLEFTLGNSANERRGFINNWTRTGFDKYDNIENADTWITTCVNNRDDRIPRSKVFANIMVMDISAHKYFLIGTNLTGLYGYIQEVLSRRLGNLFLINSHNRQDIPDDQLHVYAEERLTDILNELKVETMTVDDITRKFQKMLEGLGISHKIIESTIGELNLRQAIENTHINSPAIEITEEVIRAEASATELLANVKERLIAIGLNEEIATAVAEFLEKYIRMYRSIDNFRVFVKNRLGSPPASESMLQELNDKTRELVKKIFNDSLEMIMDPASTGDQIIDRIARCSPPGFTIRIMGAQNIKGTGLDFAYRWISLGKVMEMTPALESRDEKTRMDAIRWFGYYKEYGILDCQPAIEALEQAKTLSVNQIASTQQQIESVTNHVKAKYTEKLEQLGEVGKQGLLSHVYSILEQILDAGDSRKRRKEANSVINDLIKERISHEQASIVLRDLTKRQKGGWLEHDIRKFFSKSKQV